jgi:hypothetical protein
VRIVLCFASTAAGIESELLDHPLGVRVLRGPISTNRDAIAIIVVALAGAGASTTFDIANVIISLLLLLSLPQGPAWSLLTVLNGQPSTALFFLDPATWPHDKEPSCQAVTHHVVPLSVLRLLSITHLVNSSFRRRTGECSPHLLRANLPRVLANIITLSSRWVRRPADGKVGKMKG